MYRKEDAIMAEESKKRRISIEVDQDLHREIKMFSALRNMTLKDYILTLVQNDMKKLKKMK
jgi:hypothetical protein